MPVRQSSTRRAGGMVPGAQRALGLSALLVAWAMSPGARADEVAAGREAYKLCEGCHSLTPGEHRYGPSLAGVLNRPAGRLKGYQFSDALTSVRFRWDAGHLTQWLSDEPKNMVPGTRMEFPGLSDPQQVQALIRFLGTVKAR